MGKTFRRNKTPKFPGKKLDNHRDLPDFQEDLYDDEEYPPDEEDINNYYARRMDDKKPTDQPKKG